MPSITVHEVCREPGCHARSTYRGRCEVHRKEREDRHEGNRSRALYASPAWRALRLQVLKRDPACMDCGTAKATCVDHITPLRSGGSNSPSNLQGLCARCHSRKTRREVLL